MSATGATTASRSSSGTGPSSRSSSSPPRRAATARCGTWTSRTTPPRPGSTPPTAKTTTCGRSCARAAGSWRSSGGTGARPGSFSRCTTSRWIPVGTSTRPRWTPGSGCRNSSSKARFRRRSDRGDLEKKLTAALAAGAPPDAAHGQPITCVSFAAKGLLRPVDDLADSIPKDNLVDAFRHLCQWNGKTYGVGHSPASSVFVYRKDLLAQKGLKVPRTWDELVQVAEALKEVRDGQVVRWWLTMTG